MLDIKAHAIAFCAPCLPYLLTPCIAMWELGNAMKWLMSTLRLWTVFQTSQVASELQCGPHHFLQHGWEARAVWHHWQNIHLPLSAGLQGCCHEAEVICTLPQTIPFLFQGQDPLVVSVPFSHKFSGMR